MLSFEKYYKKTLNLPIGIHEFERCRVVKDKEITIMMPSYKTIKKEERENPTYSFSIVAFPNKEEHFRAFQKASEGLIPGEPSGYNPGGIGTINFVFPYHEPGKKLGERFLRKIRDMFYQRDMGRLYMMYVQSHFRVGKEQGPIESELATYYSGWKKSCLREAISMAEALGADLRINFIKQQLTQAAINYILKVSEEKGAQIEKEGRRLSIKFKKENK